LGWSGEVAEPIGNHIISDVLQEQILFARGHRAIFLF